MPKIVKICLDGRPMYFGCDGFDVHSYESLVSLLYETFDLPGDVYDYTLEAVNSHDGYMQILPVSYDQLFATCHDVVFLKRYRARYVAKIEYFTEKKRCRCVMM